MIKRTQKYMNLKSCIWLNVLETTQFLKSIHTCLCVDTHIQHVWIHIYIYRYIVSLIYNIHAYICMCIYTNIYNIP